MSHEFLIIIGYFAATETAIRPKFRGKNLNPLDLLAKAGAVLVSDGGDSIPRIRESPDLTEAI